MNPKFFQVKLGIEVYFDRTDGNKFAVKADGSWLIKLLLTVVFFLLATGYQLFAQVRYPGIYSGVPWYDQRGEIVSAHAAGITKIGNRYYLFGEKHADTTSAFTGFTCYSSKDLRNWKYESLALAVQRDGKLGPKRIGERVKVMRSPTTGMFIMYMHTDDLAYKDQCIGYATSNKITGPYTFQGPLLFNGQPIRKWDMGTFQDADGSGYLLLHGGIIFKLSEDYLSVATQVVKDMSPECESPAMFKKNGVYFWLASHKTSWERNDNFYFTATSLAGPWTKRGNFAPTGSLTWNSQTTFVLPIEGKKDTTFLFMGDRWSFPRQASAATYVWQPIMVAGTDLLIPKFLEAWKVNVASGQYEPIAVGNRNVLANDEQQLNYVGEWKTLTDADLVFKTASKAGAKFSFKFIGRQVGFYGISVPTGGYGRVEVSDEKGRMVFSAIVDWYAKKVNSDLKFITPMLKKGNYELTITAMGEHSKWSDKKKTVYGSTGNAINLQKITVLE